MSASTDKLALELKKLLSVGTIQPPDAGQPSASTREGTTRHENVKFSSEDQSGILLSILHGSKPEVLSLPQALHPHPQHPPPNMVTVPHQYPYHGGFQQSSSQHPAVSHPRGAVMHSAMHHMNMHPLGLGMPQVMPVQTQAHHQPSMYPQQYQNPPGIYPVS